jgi:hypothetical protein
VIGSRSSGVQQSSASGRIGLLAACVVVTAPV